MGLCPRSQWGVYKDPQIPQLDLKGVGHWADRGGGGGGKGEKRTWKLEGLVPHSVGQMDANGQCKETTRREPVVSQPHR